MDDQKSRRWKEEEEEKVGVWAWGSTTNQAKRNVQGGERPKLGLVPLGQSGGDQVISMAGTARTILCVFALFARGWVSLGQIPCMYD